MCGREAVEYFAKCLHIGKIRSMFFNIAAGRHYQPYTLIEVPKDKVSLLLLLIVLINCFTRSVYQDYFRGN